MKRSQIAGQTFIYIMAIIIVGVLALIGYQLHKNIIKRTCEVKELNFVTDFKSYVDRYDNYGTLEKIGLTLPCNTEQVCFVSSSIISQGNTTGLSQNPIILDSVRDKVQNNIFVINTEGTKAIGYAEKLETSSGLLCINQSSRVKLIFRGTGRNTIVEEDLG